MVQNKHRQIINWLSRLKCNLGFHEWKLNLNDKEGQIFGVSIRRCTKCGRRQVSANRYWQDL
ncbi:hypothetical protein I8752_22890 [Nostocaceae cyanobacterium CENA369]|uniref:Uncharacterized protein n=1 Tax=Dendronalium phyllosphericum CENA369 TaxID=1725256 RepID=A0A8J7IA82_9NOST|nr:hypothetical protein [Dendronalium phyllosphericum]MBH8575795.1 hypothetical protein [Dendronalium phyllosphericum CENA369]